MKNEVKVTVFESNNRSEIESLKKILEANAIECTIETANEDNHYITSELVLNINILDEVKAFAIIDDYLEKELK